MRKFSAPGTLFEAVLEKKRERDLKDAGNSASSVSDGVGNEMSHGRKTIKLRRGAFFAGLAFVAVLLVAAFVLGRMTSPKPAPDAAVKQAEAKSGVKPEPPPPLAFATANEDGEETEKNVTVQAACYAASSRKPADEAAEFLKTKFNGVFIRESGKYTVVYVGRFARKGDADAQETLRTVRNLKYRNIRAFKDADFYVLGK